MKPEDVRAAIVDALKAVANSEAGAAAVTILAEALRELEQLRAERRWVPVSERLPEPRTDALISVRRTNGPGSWLTIAAWTGAEWLDDNAVQVPEGLVTHWTPLPPGPEGA